MIAIRRALPEDLDVLMDFQQKLAEETESVSLDRGTLARGLTALLQDESKGMYFVAEHDGQPVGCCMITYEWSEWRNGTVWWLQSVYIIGSHRKRGVFREMFSTIMKRVKNDPELAGLRLYVDKRNANAMKVYESLGMNGEHYSVYEWMK
jgi:RimJ/RimL family protein N-acetyltransferase